MVSVSSNLRSTKTITDFVNLSDEAKTIAIRLKAIETEMQLLQPEVLEQIGEGRAVKVGSQVRTLKPGEKLSYKNIAEEGADVEYCRQHGLKFQTRSPEYVAPATFTAHAKAGLLPEELYAIERTALVVVT